MNWLVSSFLVTVLSYFRMLQGFFQQDEWFGFSEYMLRKGENLPHLLQYFFAPKVAHFTPFTISFLYLNLSTFSLNYIPHALVSLALHMVVVYLVYVFALEFSQKKIVAGVTVFVFASSASVYQATSWVMADIGTHGASIFGLLSLIQFTKFIKSKEKKAFLNSMVLLFVSLFFKEITIGLFAVYLFLLWGFSGFKKNEKILFSRKIIIWGGVYVLFRGLMVFFTPKEADNSGIVFETQSKFKFVYDFITIPIKAIGQTIVPIQIMRYISEFVSRLLPEKLTGPLGSPAFEVFVVKRVMEIISLLISVFISVLVLKKKNYSKYYLFCIFWIVINSFVFAFSPQRNGITSVLDSRNLYFVSIGMAFLVGLFYSKLISDKKRRAIVVLGLIFLPNIYFLNKNLSDFIEVSQTRKSILNRIKIAAPNLPKKVVFYTQSNQSYYGLPEEEKIMPFQSGFGQTLLVWYYPEENFSRDFYKNRFLWKIEDQGYKEVGDRGFGYFRDLDLLKSVVEQYNLPEESIIGFSWNSNKNTLNDISKEIVEKLYENY